MKIGDAASHVEVFGKDYKVGWHLQVNISKPPS